jgi:hypothetical protein
VDLGIVMRGEVLHDKCADEGAGRAVATWNTRRLPTRLTPGWTNRLFVACSGWWRGYFPLSGDIFWNPRDATAPYGLIFDPRVWTPIPAARAPAFRGWRYLDGPPDSKPSPSAAPAEDRQPAGEARSSKHSLKKRE